MRSPVSLAPVLLTSGCLLVNPAYGDEDTGTSTAGGTALTSGAPSSTGSTADLTTAATAEGSGSNSDSATTGGATTGGAGSTGQATASTGCGEENLYPDGDGDGYGVDPAEPVCPGTPGYAAKNGDCDDGNGGINPDAAELCDPDKVDEDCDGLLNEFSPSNATCDGCNLNEYNGHSYWFCPPTVNWDSARGTCQGFGKVDMVVMNDGTEDQWVYAQTSSSTTWIGCRDTDPNVMYNYFCVDGQPLGYEYWVGPNPDEDNGCIAMPNGDGGGWRDRPCTDTYQFVCESL